jgi:hypothetical protein
MESLARPFGPNFIDLINHLLPMAKAQGVGLFRLN